MQLPEATARIKMLRNYYLTYAPMAVGEGRELHGDYPNYGTRQLLFTEGWLENVNAGNTRLRYSLAEAYMLKHTRPVIVPGELLVGQPDMDWPSRYTPEKRKELKDLFYSTLKTPFFAREGHLAFDYTALLSEGLCGMIDRLRAGLNALDMTDGRNAEHYEFYVCSLAELEALLDLAERYAQAAEAMAEERTGTEKEELLSVAALMRRVPAHPARTFREALESIHFYTFNLQGLFSFGRVDEYLLPYYEADLAAGRLTREEAQELIDCFCLLFAPTVPPWAAAGFMIGGVDRQGRPVENDLTWLFMNSISHTHLPDPGIGLCVTQYSSEDLLRFAAALLAKGETHPAIWNDDAVIRNLIALGYAPEDARQYTHSTCVELTPVGCANVQITSPYVNMAEAFLNVFYDFSDGEPFDALLTRYERALNDLFSRLMLEVNLGLLEKQRNGMIDPARVSCLIRDCIGSGTFKERGGAVYNRTACDFLGLANVAECFNVIRVLVYEEKKVTMAQLQEAVKADYEGFAPLLAMIKNTVTHFGNNDPASDALAKRVADMACRCAANHKDIHGFPVIPGAFSYDNHVEYGALTKATPDGRRDFAPLHDGSNPVQGYDVAGPTATLLSVSAYEPSRFSGGIACNIKISKDTPDLPNVLLQILHGFRTLNVPEMQVTVSDREELLAAQKDPEQYRNLLVRVGGFSDFFVKLDPRVQEEIIRRTEH